MPTALITGANRGLGLELTRQYLDDGWHIIALCRKSSDALDSLRQSSSLDIVLANLTDDAELRAATDSIEAPAIDVLINNAGTMGDGNFEEEGLIFQAFGAFDRDEWLRVFDINICTPMAVTELLVDKLKAADNGRIITMSSYVGSNTLNTSGGLYAYRASKSAVNSIVKSMSVNLKEFGIISAALHPGWVRTDMGGKHADIDAVESATGMRTVIDGLTIEDSGRFIAYDGSEMPY